jgi:hypothetical protein
MTARLSIVEARRGRAALGRQILGTALGVVIVAGMLIAWPDNGLSVPAGPPPKIAPPQVSSGGDRQVIAVGQGTRRNRCDVSGFANGVPLIFEIDTGDPNIADFPSSYVDKLGIGGPLDYSEWFPGTRYGTIATTTLRQIRVGDVVWNDPDVNVFSDWDYTFGDEEVPLLGLGALKTRGVDVEFDEDGRCRLTAARNGRAES